ncbi:MAG: class I SAM-dependent methyltransferase [Chitinophagales bacterium]
MKEDRLSQTALKTAFYRAYHSRCDSPKIFDDFLAYDLIGEREYNSIGVEMITGFKKAAPQMADSFPDEKSILAFMMQAMAPPTLTISRARYAEDCLKEAIGDGMNQYIILGAGLDTFAFRNRELLDRLHILEIDHPATQEFKRSRLTETNWEEPSNLHFVAADFTKEKLGEVLNRSSFDSRERSFFNWLGVTYYLPRDIVLETLREIAVASAKGSMVVFDYFDTDIMVPEKVPPRVYQILMLAEQVGEPIQALFDPSTLAEELEGLGLIVHENLCPVEVESRYYDGRTDDYHACENAHFACAIVK